MSCGLLLINSYERVTILYTVDNFSISEVRTCSLEYRVRLSGKIYDRKSAEELLKIRGLTDHQKKIIITTFNLSLPSKQ